MKKPDKRFWPSIADEDGDDDEIAGGGVPDDDGMIYLRKPRVKKAKKEPRNGDKGKKPAG